MKSHKGLFVHSLRYTTSIKQVTPLASGGTLPGQQGQQFSPWPCMLLCLGITVDCGFAADLSKNHNKTAVYNFPDAYKYACHMSRCAVPQAKRVEWQVCTQEEETEKRKWATN